LPNSKAEKSARSKLPPLTAAEKKRVWAILFLIATFIPALISYTMIWNVGIVWIDEKVSLGPIPASWFNSVDSFASIIIAPVLVGLWASQARRNVEPEALTKLRQAKALIAGRPIDLEVDGGINPETAALVSQAGANVLVAGSAVFAGNDPKTYAPRIKAIRTAATSIKA